MGTDYWVTPPPQGLFTTKAFTDISLIMQSGMNDAIPRRDVPGSLFAGDSVSNLRALLKRVHALTVYDGVSQHVGDDAQSFDMYKMELTLEGHLENEFYDTPHLHFCGTHIGYFGCAYLATRGSLVYNLRPLTSSRTWAVISREPNQYGKSREAKIEKVGTYGSPDLGRDLLWSITGINNGGQIVDCSLEGSITVRFPMYSGRKFYVNNQRHRTETYYPKGQDTMKVVLLKNDFTAEHSAGFTTFVGVRSGEDYALHGYVGPPTLYKWRKNTILN